MVREDFRTLYCDPGEDFGWCLGKGMKLLAGGTEKMWPFADEIWMALNGPEEGSIIDSDEYLRRGIDPDENTGPIGRIVCEDFRIYPWKAKSLGWDRVRTARVIGAITFMCRLKGIPLVFQPAAIKRSAQAAGAEELYWHPLRENRHQNDAVQHFVFFTYTELLGNRVDVVPEMADETDVD